MFTSDRSCKSQITKRKVFVMGLIAGVGAVVIIAVVVVVAAVTAVIAGVKDTLKDE